MKRRLFLPVLLWGMFTLVSEAAIQPYSFRLITDREYVFCANLLGVSTAHFTIVVYDSTGKPVPGGTPFCIQQETPGGEFRSPQLFKTTANKASGGMGYYFFTTDPNGKIEIDFYPLTMWRRRNLYIYGYRVRFSDPSDSSSAEPTVSVALDSSGSSFPHFVGPDSVVVDIRGGRGEPQYDEYFFLSFKPSTYAEKAYFTLKVYDEIGRPVPENTPIAVQEVFPYLTGSDLQSATRFHVYKYPNDGDTYYFRTNANGEIEFIYTIDPKQERLLLPVSHEYYTSYSQLYSTVQEFWERYKKPYFRKLGFGYFAVDLLEDGNPVPILYAPHLVGLRKQLKVKQDSLFFVLPDRVVCRVRGIFNGDQYLFTSYSKIEPALVEMQVFDEIGRPVPEGTGVEVYLDYYIYGTELVGKGVNKILIGRYRIFLGPQGKATFYYFPPFYPLAFDKGLNSYRRPFHPKDLIFSDPEQQPTLVAPKYASIRFSPPELLHLQGRATVTVEVKDQMGRPVPPGTRIRLYFNRGTIRGMSKGGVFTIQKDGKARFAYISPTRNIFYNGSAYFALSTYQQVYIYQPGWRDLAEAWLKMRGAYLSPYNRSITQLLLGKTITGLLKELNPIAFVGSLKRFTEAAELARQKRIELIRAAGDPDIDDAAFEQKYQEFMQAFAGVVNHMQEFVLDVPGMSFNPTMPLGVSSAATTVIEQGVKQQLANHVYSGLVTNQIISLSIQFVQFKARLHYGSSGGVRFQKPRQQETGAFWLQLLTPFYVLPSQSGMFELFALKFRVIGTGGAVRDSVITPGSRTFVSVDEIPWYLGFRVSPGAPMQAGGILEVTAVDTAADAFDASVLGIVFRSPYGGELDYVDAVKAPPDSTVELSWVDGTRILLPAGSVADSTLLFLTGVLPPSPLIYAPDTVAITAAYALGSLSLPDSSIQHVDLLQDAVMKIFPALAEQDSLSSHPALPYFYDETQKKWIPLPLINAAGEDSLLFYVSGTGIYGIGRKIDGIPTEVQEISAVEAPVFRYILHPPFPNPSNPETTIAYELARDGRVEIRIVDLMGRLIKKLVDRRQQAGRYRITWDGRNSEGIPVTSGVYFVVMRVREASTDFLYHKTQKIVLLR